MMSRDSRNRSLGHKDAASPSGKEDQDPIQQNSLRDSVTSGNERKKWKTWAFLILLPFLVVLTFNRVGFFSNEPGYNGKPLSEWLRRLPGGVENASSESDPFALTGLEIDYVNKESASSIQKIGTNALPYLLRLMESRNNRLTLLISSMERKLFKEKRLRYSMIHHRHTPAAAIALFYEEAALIKPDLEHLIKSGHPAVKQQAELLLDWIDQQDD